MTFEALLQQKIDSKTKPVGALGKLEQIAFQIGSIQQSLEPTLINPHIIVFAADHGLAQEGVSAYPPEVTYQMVLNFLNKGAAINVFCEQNDIAIQVVDAGVNFDFEPHPSLLQAKAGHGSQNCLYEPAMTKKQLDFCLSSGRKTVADIAQKGCNIIGFGEMGIGNTSSASLLMSSLLSLPIEECIGRGTGMNKEGLLHKTQILQEVLKKHPHPNKPEDVLQYFGGFEIAQICGGMLEAFAHNMTVMIDGFITSSAFLVANAIEPKLIQNTIFCHQSDENGHRLLLEKLKVSPVLQLDMRLGEGTGCALAYPIISNAVAFLNKMASFESANVARND